MKITFRHSASHADRKRGFSLAETVIAVGIVATALLPLIALLGTTTRSQLTSTDRMSTALIADAVFEELAASAPEPALFVREPEPGGGLKRVVISAKGAASRQALVHFIAGVEGGLIGKIDEGVYESGYQTAGVELGGEMPGTILRLQLAAEDSGEAGIPGGGGLVRVRLSVEHPVDAGRVDRHKEVFETFMNLSDK